MEDCNKGCAILPPTSIMPTVKEQLKPIILNSLRITDMTPEDLRDDQPLLGGELEIDSVDILQLVLEIEGTSVSSWWRPTSTRNILKVSTLWRRSSNPRWRQSGPDPYTPPVGNSTLLFKQTCTAMSLSTSVVLSGATVPCFSGCC